MKPRHLHDNVGWVRTCAACKEDSMNMAMENLAVLDLLVREGYSAKIVDRVERALAQYSSIRSLRKTQEVA